MGAAAMKWMIWVALASSICACASSPPIERGRSREKRSKRPVVVEPSTAASPKIELETEATIKDRPDRLLMIEKSDLKERERLTRVQIAEDVDLLTYALRKGYGGRKYIDAAIFREVLDELRGLPSRLPENVSSRELLDAADPILFKITDSHLVLRSPRTGLSRNRKEQLRKGGVGANFSARGPDGKSRPWSFGVHTSGSSRLPVLSINFLAAPEDPAWSGFKEAVERALSEPIIAIDLRGNGGGSDSMGAWLASRILGAEVLSPFDAIRRSSTLETLAMSVNQWKLQILWKRLDKKPVPSYFRKRLREKMREFARAKRSLPPDEETFVMEYRSQVTRPKFEGRIIVLIDAECASSCETIVEFFENAPNVILAGENTAGAVHFGNPGALVLPNSQLMAQIPSDHWRYRDGRSLERIGHQPKIRVNAGEDALDAAMRLMNAVK